MKNVINLLILMLFVSLFLNFNKAQAGSYYVSHDGTATWNQATNIATPCVAATAMQNAQSGDTVYFRGGTYSPADPADWENNALQPSNSGSDGSPITFIAYPGEIPIIESNTVGGAFGVVDQDWIVWDGFNCDVQEHPSKIYKAIFLRNADHVTIQNCDLEGNSSATWMNNGTISINNSVDYLDVHNCKIHGAKGGGNSTGFLIYDLANSNIYNNDIYDNNSGIYFKRESNDNNVYQNYFKNNMVNNVYISGSTYANTNIHIYKNISVNTLTGTISMVNVFEVGENGGTLSGLTVYNNTFYNSSASNFLGINQQDTASLSNVESYNNIFYTFYRAKRFYTPQTTYCDYNCYYDITLFQWEGTTYYNLSAWQTASSLDGNSITSDPKIDNIGSENPSDYHLAYDSPCKGTGKDRQDMGAYPNGDDGTVIGYTPPGPPSRPDKRTLWLLSH